MGPRTLIFSLLAILSVPVWSHPHQSHHRHHHYLHESHLKTRDSGGQLVCPPVPNKLFTGADLLAKVRYADRSTCDAKLEARSSLATRADSAIVADPNDPYSCSEQKPCANGACCSKAGVCNYGPEACGTNGKSPNDKCWSNCDAHAECGRYAKIPGQKCPLNVCCSRYGFCGMTKDFCKVTSKKEESCQSNCAQPGSGGSKGDVQKRVIGYYEAWNYKKKCIGMSMEDIPVDGLTHIYYSFGYIQPKTFKIVPMQDEKDGSLTTETFAEFTALKRKNPSLRAVIALGGWTFNDNHTIWQPVFSDLSSTSAKRATFVSELVKFMDRYGFDGVDIDWEYPGASDRGGKPDDGENLTKLFKEIRVGFDKMSGRHKEISFTAPTSYWYMRHFDITASAKAVDYINVMSYDLHGIWDADNPIGSQVLAHSNLTEIDLALDLFWRNKVDPSKINMGIGFYGRSFQLANPACHKPGCLYLGGAKKGPCTGNSGTLSYFEIMDIIEKYDLTPYWDKDAAVKYVTWGGDQWVSYDDKDTIQQKIEFANALGLGGLLIWAIDLDNQRLDALAAVLHPKGFSAHKDRSTKNPWVELGEGHCTVNDCGTTGCKSGWIEVDQSPCDRLAGKKTSICCPFASAPDADKCTWRGGENDGVLCNGQCHEGEVALASSQQAGGGNVCTDGRKFLCCKAEAQVPECRWTGCNEKCYSSENELTWKNGNCRGKDQKKFCCSKEQTWKNCKWHGKPGNCFDNHCDTGWQVALTTSHGGEGEDCGWASKRQRTYCCDPPKGESPFLPVPLEYLFPDPPSEKDAESDFQLKVDSTWGGAEDLPFVETPEQSAFGFIIMTSPDELQTSLSKRDGSHWEVFDCNDSVSEGEHTVRMVCTDRGDTSNCGNIYLGHGAPGTIVEMPEGCGPGKYAVVKELSHSKNQSIPQHIYRRGIDDSEPVLDLTFDYDFRRVPRDLGDTQIRLDYSNENSYWNTIVDKAADSKKRSFKRSVRRSLQDVGGSHKRWLEEEWREDVHQGALSNGDIHKRWFGETALDWLKAMFDGVTNTQKLEHRYSEDFILDIIDQDFTCPNVDGKLKVYAEMSVNANVNYGFTMIGKLGGSYGIDISDSYLYYRTGGNVEAKFVIDAAVTAHFDTGDVLMFSADTFGAAFTVPGIVTVGPNFKLYGQLEGKATLGVDFETQVKLAEWDIYQTFPVVDKNWEPGTFEPADKSGKQALEPEFEYGVAVSGHLSAHVKPTITFGIDWNKKFASIDSCSVNLVADGHVTFHAEAEAGGRANRFCYGVDVGADLYATIEAPKMFSWALPTSPFMLTEVNDVTIFPSGLKNEACASPSSKTTRRRDTTFRPSRNNNTSSLSKRATRYGPLIPKLEGLFCAGEVDFDGIPPCDACGSDSKTGHNDALQKREEEICWLDPYATKKNTCPTDSVSSNAQRSLRDRSVLEPREQKNPTYWAHAGGSIDLHFPTYPSCGVARGDSKIKKWYGYPKKQPKATPCEATLKPLRGDKVNMREFVTEHIYEAQLLREFFDWMVGDKRSGSRPFPVGYTRPDRNWISEVLFDGIATTQPNRLFKASTWTWHIWDEMAAGLGSDNHPHLLVLADAGMNGRKAKLFTLSDISPMVEINQNQLTRRSHRNYAGVFQFMNDQDVWEKFVESSQHMESVLAEFDQEYPWTSSKHINIGQPGVPTRSRGEPKAGLRDLYCFWLETRLTEIEDTGRNWVRAATANYRSAFGLEPDGKKWLDNVLKPQGLISESKLKFPAASTRPIHRSPNPSQPDIWTASNFRDLWELGAAGPF
ncbi:related to chitinase [Fusarium torulosum]|uniref:chitinase n=1 Tax=Fusarium torulosum TaxID=33205 RepID=A0AAE8MC63_9HYPO|nr:related to chitinase [Fusarium torulosum]